MSVIITSILSARQIVAHVDEVNIKGREVMLAASIHLVLKDGGVKMICIREEQSATGDEFDLGLETVDQAPDNANFEFQGPFGCVRQQATYFDDAAGHVKCQVDRLLITNSNQALLVEIGCVSSVLFGISLNEGVNFREFYAPELN